MSEQQTPKKVSASTYCFGCKKNVNYRGTPVASGHEKVPDVVKSNCKKCKGELLSFDLSKQQQKQEPKKLGG